MTVGVDQTGLTTGSYTGSISVTQSGAANSPLNDSRGSGSQRRRKQRQRQPHLLAVLHVILIGQRCYAERSDIEVNATLDNHVRRNHRLCR